jgi:hypothetical protein
VKHHTPAAAPPKRTLSLSQLSGPRQALVRLCQSIDYGQILDLQVCDCQPVFSPPPTVLLDIKLDTDSGGRPESELADFALCDEVCRLLDRLDQMQAGQIQRIEVRAGIARRVLIQTKLTGGAQ